MRRRVLALSMSLFSLGIGSAVRAESGISPDVPTTEQLKTKGIRKKLFGGMTFTNRAGESLSFVIMEPEQARARALPLVVCLHESATPRQSGKQIDGFALDLASQPSRKRMPCIIVAPLTPDEWTTTSHAKIAGQPMPDKAGESMRLIVDLVEELIRTHKVDRKRIYIVGRDIGGSGALEAAARRPDLFAGLVAFEPHAYQDLGKRLGKLPVKIVEVSGALGESGARNKSGKSKGGSSSEGSTSSNAAGASVAAGLKAAGATRVSSAEVEWDENGRNSVAEWLFRQKR